MDESQRKQIWKMRAEKVLAMDSSERLQVYQEILLRNTVNEIQHCLDMVLRQSRWQKPTRMMDFVAHSVIKYLTLTK